MSHNWIDQTMAVPTREQTLALLLQHNDTPSLINHAKSVEAVMRHLARRAGEDEEVWGAIGLVHDLDYEKHPDEHCQKTKEFLEANDWPPEYVRAVLSHGWGICTDIEPQSLLERTLYTIDELSGFVTACALVRPSRSVMDLEVKSVKKKWKQKSFAAGVDRDVVQNGIEMLNTTFEEITGEVITAMRGVAKEIDL